MTRPWPSTLFGQTLLALLVGIGLSLAAGAWIYASARQEAVRTVGALGAAERIVNLSRLLDDAPVAWRERLVRGVSDPEFRVSISADPVRITASDSGYASRIVQEYLATALPGRKVSVSVAGGDAEPRQMMGPRAGGFGPGPAGPMMHGGSYQGQMPHPMRPGAAARAGMSWRSLEAAVALADGHWLAVSTTLPDSGPNTSARLLAALAVAALMIAALTAWAVRRMTAPIATLERAAELFGRNVDAPPLAVAGPREIEATARAFNGMQERLRRLIENRTLMLAALSHDLRTQLTLLRLRAETVEAAENRERMLGTIAEMESMLTATLAFARDEAASEPRKRTDAAALAASIVDDLADAGLPVTAGSMPAIELECKPVALRRAITNLIDNAVKYGGRATVSVVSTPDTVEVLIEDEGPGIPEHELAHVLQPFYRLESSRSRDTGGIGLGLAIAAAIAQAHGGGLTLANRREGGLRASLKLPR